MTSCTFVHLPANFKEIVLEIGGKNKASSCPTGLPRLRCGPRRRMASFGIWAKTALTSSGSSSIATSKLANLLDRIVNLAEEWRPAIHSILRIV
jgi:hypothetical protein